MIESLNFGMLEAKHHLKGVQQLYSFGVSLVRKCIPPLPLLSGGLFQVVVCCLVYFIRSRNTMNREWNYTHCLENFVIISHGITCRMLLMR